MIKIEQIEFIKNIFAKYCSEKIIEINFLGRGACNNVYYILTENGSEYGIKEERSDKIDSETNDLLTEALLVSKIHQANPKIAPEIIFINELPKVYAYKYIRGDLLEAKWQSLEEPIRTEFMQELGQFMAEFHTSLSVKELNLLKNIKEKRSFADEFRDTMLLIKSVCGTNNELYKLSEKIYLSLQNFNYYTPIRSLVHGDIHKGNIIINNNHLSGIIDFGDCQIADINYDFSHLARQYPEYIDYVIKGYEKNSKNILQKELILIYGIIMDIEKIVYHLNRYEIGTKKLTDKIKSTPILQKLLT